MPLHLVANNSVAAHRHAIKDTLLAVNRDHNVRGIDIGDGLAFRRQEDKRLQRKFVRQQLLPLVF